MDDGLIHREKSHESRGLTWRAPFSGKSNEACRWTTAGMLCSLVLLATIYRILVPVNHEVQLPFTSPLSHRSLVDWQPCGHEVEGRFQCANISVPLDWHNTSDSRVVSIAVLRLPALDQKNRKGAIFVNPGGPGGSGNTFVQKWGKSMSWVLKGQYDLIGFDPRGIGASRPYVSCFPSALDEQVYELSAKSNSINIPSNLSTPGVYDDISRQIEVHAARVTALAQHCVDRSGPILPFLGTEFVVKDIDHLSRVIEGEDRPINWWGFSYGSIIGQYMVQILPPERLGRIIIDGPLTGEVWSHNADKVVYAATQDVEKVLESFASSCLTAGHKCALVADHNFTSSRGILAAIDHMLDNLYEKPVPILDLDIPAVATSSSLRGLMFHSLYTVGNWGTLAERLSEGLRGDFTGIVAATLSRVDPAQVLAPDSSAYTNPPIMCADAEPYSKEHAPPTNAEIAQNLFNHLQIGTRHFGTEHWDVVQCAFWTQAGLPRTRSRYAGPFTMANDTLKTPILIMTNTYDLVSPLAEAKLVNNRLGNNARLVQQIGGLGHCALSHFSFCSAHIVREYMLYGQVPDKDHTGCPVNQVPFEPFERPTDLLGDVEAFDLWNNWKALSHGFGSMRR